MRGDTMAAATGAPGSLEAIVLATGPSRIRLVTRTGRRITAPVSSWDQIWQFVRAAPAVREECQREGCTQEAYFRYRLAPGLASSWTCEDHLPHGLTAQFSGDLDEPPEMKLSCTFCGGPVILGSITHLTEHATVSHRCNDCDARWWPLISRGLGDDGTILAQAVQSLRTLEGLSVIELRMGYRSYRDLCRALGVGNTQHIDGLPIVQDARLEDQLTLAIEQRPADNDLVDAFMYALEASKKASLGHPALTEAPYAVGETWFHRRNENILVTIVEVNSSTGVVTVEARESAHRHEIKFLELARYYKRLYIRTSWEILESEDEHILGVEKLEP